MDAKDVLAALGGVEGVLFLATIMIRFAGLEDTPWGKRILALGKDLIGFVRAKKEAELEARRGIQNETV